MKFTQWGEKYKTFAAALVEGTRDDETATKIQLEPLTDDTIRRIIRDCAANIMDGLVRCLRSSIFTVQLDDVVNLAVLLCFVS